MKARRCVGRFHGLRHLGVIAVAAAVCSCASIIHGAHQDVGISSNPTGAQVSVDGQVKGTAPIVANLTRKDNHIVRIELAGYKPYETTLTRKVSGWVWGNVVFGGLIGLAVDAISGGLYNLTPEQISGALLAGTAGIVPKGDGLYVVVVLAPKPEWQKVGQLERG
jgi:tetrahydromethanopterin S-methyltransferase subunit E